MSLEEPQVTTDTKLTRTPSNLSSTMTEDWDKSFSLSSTPQPNGDLALPTATTAGSGAGANGKEESNRRSLTDLMRLYAERGEDLKLTAEEEKSLKEELGLWINSDSSPYEGDDNPNAPQQ